MIQWAIGEHVHQWMSKEQGVSPLVGKAQILLVRCFADLLYRNRPHRHAALSRFSSAGLRRKRATVHPALVIVPQVVALRPLEFIEAGKGERLLRRPAWRQKHDRS